MDWLHEHPEVKTIRVAAADLNGVARGKRIPARFAEKLLTEGTKFPFSVLNMDIWGEDIENSPLVFEAGDPDGLLLPTERGFMPMPWLEAPTALLPIWMFRENGTPYEGDPRHALNAVVQRFKARGLTPVCAMELEFFLIDDSGKTMQVPASPRSGKRRKAAETLSIRALDAFDTFFTDLYDACEAMDIPADTAISESGLGQFEINLMHVADPLEAADDALLFKRLVRGIARKHGFAATFMAKPYGDRAGSGMHVHFSLNDAEGRNIFDNGGDEGTEILRHAVAGLIRTMQENALVFAPHENSFRRILPGAHAPSSVAWGYENRTVAVRIPGGSPKARRIEHRVAGADANPYLVLASILGGALLGIEGKWEPPAPITGDAYSQNIETLPPDWASAIEAFSRGPHVTQIYARRLQRMFVQCKLQELRRFTRHVTEFEYHSYMEAV